MGKRARNKIKAGQKLEERSWWFTALYSGKDPTELCRESNFYTNIFASGISKKDAANSAFKNLVVNGFLPSDCRRDEVFLSPLEGVGNGAN